MGILAAERHRLLTGEGQFIKLSLADVAMAMVGNLGYIGEAQVNHEDHYSFGNYLYGAYGRDFETKDDRYVYVVAITKRQWQALCKATGLRRQAGADRTAAGRRSEPGRRSLQGARRDLGGPAAVVPGADAGRGTAAPSTAPASAGGRTRRSSRWSPRIPAARSGNPMFSMLEQPGIGRYLVPGSPLDFSAVPRETPRRAPVLGEHTDEVLADVLGLSDGAIGKLREKRIVGGPIEL